METLELMCETPLCSFQNHPFGVEDNGTEIICSGECGNILRPDNPDHPNYPVVEEPEPTVPVSLVQDLIQQALRELGVIE